MDIRYPASVRPSSSWTFTVLLSLAAMMLIVVACSYFFFINQSLRLDEAQSLWQTSGSPLTIIKLVAGDVHVPLYHLMLHYWRLIVGDTVARARVMSLVFLLGTIPAIYVLGKETYGRGAGLFAALLLSISPFMNWYGNEIRMYTLFSFIVVLNQYFFIRIFTRPGRGAWVGYTVTTLFGIFSHYFFFLNLFAQAVFFFLNRKLFPPGALKRFLLIAAAIVILFIPWIVEVLSVGTFSSEKPLLAEPTTVNLFSTLSQFLFGFQDNEVNTIVLSLWPIAIIFGFVSVRSRKRPSPVTIYLLLSIVLSVGLAFIISATVVPVFVSRYLAFTVPSLYVLLAAHVASYPAKYRKWVGGVLVALLLFMMGVEAWSAATPVKENYRQATDYLNANVSPQDVVILSAPFTIYPVEYYYQNPAPLETLPIWNRYSFGAIPNFDKSTLPAQVATLTQDHQDVWLLLSYDQGYESNIKSYFDTHFARIQEKNFSQDLNVYEYKIRY